MRPGIVLVHGYSGSPENLVRLARELAGRFGADSLASLCLPGHEAGQTPVFDEKLFVDAVSTAIGSAQRRRPLIVLGHSTGGVIVLSALIRSGVVPDLLVLASAPRKIDTSYLERWSAHRSGKSPLPFSSVANMVSFINRTGAQTLDARCPVLVLHGTADDLVPCVHAHAWEQGAFRGPVRTVLVPGAGHDLFREANHQAAIDLAVRAISDVTAEPVDSADSAALCAVEPETGPFTGKSPFSLRHLLSSPSGRTALGRDPLNGIEPAGEPTIANIEITTRCNLKCTYCVRSIRGSAGEDMPKEAFRTVLGLLPHAYRITLVGLGETLLHPDVVDLVAEASSQQRRVALVTNAMLLTEDLSRELLKAGLESIAFSVDGSTQAVASRVRPGTDLERVAGNIRKFVELSRSMRPVSTAVFSAVSADTIESLDQLIDLVSGLGVHVMMLTDLNFRENLDRTLWKNADRRTAGLVRSAVSRAFRKNLPVLSVHGLEEFGLWTRYHKFLLVPPARLYQRSRKRTWCWSPWQTLPVNVRGEVTLCDCQPEVKAGSLLTQPLTGIWKGAVFREHRARMVSDDPPEACRICPRF